MSFDYTQVYKDIYNVIKKDNIPHEQAHNASLKISNALSDLFLSSEGYDIDIIPILTQAMIGIVSDKFGGYDLDDNKDLK